MKLRSVYGLSSALADQDQVHYTQEHEYDYAYYGAVEQPFFRAPFGVGNTAFTAESRTQARAFILQQNQNDEDHRNDYLNEIYYFEHVSII
jgi:hypothetical protein